uniref:uncharacterized protein LOC120342416 n=1 Tax=Styela clava TaxID=7725 RepID=UPI001939500D|nr:uncharacterized protein LOC120342416 [Styela clava]
MEQHYENATSQTYNWTSSNSTTETPEQSFVYWMINLIVTFVVAATAMYIFTALIYKEISTSGKEDSQTMTSARLMRIVKITMAFLVFTESVTYASFRILSFYGNPDYCYIEEIARGIVANIGSFNIYVLFWLRQRILYKNPVLKDLTNVLTRTLSTVAIALIVIWHIALGVIFSRVPFIHEIVNYKCKLIVSGTITGLVWIALFATVALLQSILLFLFLHPLYKHRIKSKWMNNKNVTDLLPVMQRAFAGTLAFVVSGAVINMTGGFIKHDWIGPILNSIGQFLDVVIVTLSFADWKQTILFRSEEKARESATTMKTTVRISLNVEPKSKPNTSK